MRKQVYSISARWRVDDYDVIERLCSIYRSNDKFYLLVFGFEWRLGEPLIKAEVGRNIERQISFAGPVSAIFQIARESSLVEIQIKGGNSSSGLHQSNSDMHREC